MIAIILVQFSKTSTRLEVSSSLLMSFFPIETVIETTIKSHLTRKKLFHGELLNKNFLFFFREKELNSYVRSSVRALLLQHSTRLCFEIWHISARQNPCFCALNGFRFFGENRFPRTLVSFLDVIEPETHVLEWKCVISSGHNFFEQFILSLEV